MVERGSPGLVKDNFAGTAAAVCERDRGEYLMATDIMRDADPGTRGLAIAVPQRHLALSQFRDEFDPGTDGNRGIAGRGVLAQQGGAGVPQPAVLKTFAGIAVD